MYVSNIHCLCTFGGKNEAALVNKQVRHSNSFLTTSHWIFTTIHSGMTRWHKTASFFLHRSYSAAETAEKGHYRRKCAAVTAAKAAASHKTPTPPLCQFTIYPHASQRSYNPPLTSWRIIAPPCQVNITLDTKKLRSDRSPQPVVGRGNT